MNSTIMFIITFLTANTLLGGVLATLLPYVRLFHILVNIASFCGLPMVLPTVAALLHLAKTLHYALRMLSLAGLITSTITLAVWVYLTARQSEVVPMPANMAAARDLHSSPPDDVFSELLLEDDSPASNAAHALEAARLRSGRTTRSTRAFLHHWVSALRCHFPARADRPADRAAMATWLSSKMRERNMRYAHIADCMPRIVALALQESRAEVEAKAMADAAKLRTAGGRWWFDMKAKMAGWVGITSVEALGAGPAPPPAA